jgi:type I restriction enzyme M protein
LKESGVKLGNFNYASFIWSVADKLRGPYGRADYGKVILPFAVLRRLDCTLEATKDKVLELAKDKSLDGVTRDVMLQAAAGYKFYNTSPFDLKKAIGDPSQLRQNIVSYLNGFSPNIRDVFEKYEFETELAKLEEYDLLLLVAQEFLKLDLHPDKVSNSEMGNVFENLISRSMEAANEQAGEYFTPRDVVRLMVNLLFARDGDILTKPDIVRHIYDPTAGTGGMLAIADEYIRSRNPKASLSLYGQEIRAASYAVSKTDLIIKGQNAENMILGDTLKDDGHWDKKFDYCLANPPFGVEWKASQDAVTKEHEQLGFSGRFGPGLPRVSDGSLLFLLHLVSKMRSTENEGGRIGIVLNGSPLFTGGAGSGESEIRKWLMEKDLVEAIVAMPKDMFYNTGIATYIWILDNDKPKERKNKVQLIDGSQMYQKLRKNIGSKRVELSETNIEDLVKLYEAFEDGEQSKIFKTEEFGYTTITVERPLRQSWTISEEKVLTLSEITALKKLSPEDRLKIREILENQISDKKHQDKEEFSKHLKSLLLELKDLTAAQLNGLVKHFAERFEEAPIVLDKKGKAMPDPELRDTENVPLAHDIDEYVKTEIEPHISEFWVDRDKDKVGYEIPFTRHFYKYFAPRPLSEIDKELNLLLVEISVLLKEVEK